MIQRPNAPGAVRHSVNFHRRPDIEYNRDVFANSQQLGSWRETALWEVAFQLSSSP